MLGVLTILVSFKKCLFNSIAHYSLTNKTHSHQRLKHWHEITRFEVTFQLGWSYLPAWHTPCELGESKSNCSSLRHVKRLDESKKLQEFMKFCLQVSHNANVKHSKSTWRQLTILYNESYKIITLNVRSAFLYRGDVKERSTYDNIVVLISEVLLPFD